MRFRKSGMRRQAVIALAAVLLTGCAGTPPAPGGVWAAGEIAGRPFAARVDSEIARYYLEDFPAPHPEGWHEALAKVEDVLPDGVVSDRALAQVSRRFGSVDLAALVFMDQVHARPENAAFAACFAAVSRRLALPDADPERLFAGVRGGYRVLLAPGWLYESNPQTEADFARTRAALDRIGMPYRFLATPEDATVEENAAIIAQAIRRLAGDGRRVIVVSASKSAAEVAWALGHLLEPDEAVPVAAWINAGGIVRGTPLADHWSRFPRSLAARAAFLRYGWRYASLLSIRTEPSRERLTQVELPADLLVVNYIAVPMASQVTPEARNRYRLLARNGPNDGLAPLASTAVDGGTSLVEPGADHYFLTVDIGLRTLALTRVVQLHLEGRPCTDGTGGPGHVAPQHAGSGAVPNPMISVYQYQ